MRPEESHRLVNSVSDLQESICQHVRYSLGKEWKNLSGRDLFLGVALAVRDRLVERMLETEERYQRTDAKRLYYLSMEFLMGRSLGNNLYNLGIFDLCRDALFKMGVDLEEVEESESDAALGNGGLGRLAACFLDCVAALEAASITGTFAIPESVERAAAQREGLASHNQLRREIDNLRTQAHKETQINRRVELNLAIKRLCRQTPSILHSVSDGIYSFLAIAQFHRAGGFIEWFPENPFSKEFYWK